MRDALTGKVAIVTGASRGIGAAIARRFAAEGARVAIVARSLEPGSGGHLAGSLREVADDIAADGGVALPIVADLSDPACDRAAIVEQTAASFDSVDVLVNNAAACFYLSIDETSERRLRVACGSTITPYLLAKAAVPAMRERCGLDVSIASVIADSAPPGRSFGPVRATCAPSEASINRLTGRWPPSWRRGHRGQRGRPRCDATERDAVMPTAQWCEPIKTMAGGALALATAIPKRTGGSGGVGPYLRSGSHARSTTARHSRDLHLAGRTTLVTGSRSRIGRAAEALAAGGVGRIADVDDGALATAASIGAADRV
jgi:NAD(P)-dependent dehydrogenase (short-subunit alcohol dehydrogenase family)